MLNLNRSQQRLPRGGHHFSQYGVTFRADTFPLLVEKLKDFRKVNNYQIGQPEQDILQFYAKHWPFMVESDDQDVIPEASTDYTEWRDWVHKVWKLPPSKFLSSAEAQDRIKVCADCPFLVDKAGWKKSEEFTEVSKRAFLLRRGMSVPDFIGYCACHRADLGSLLFIENAAHFSNRPEDREKPKECWV